MSESAPPSPFGADQFVGIAGILTGVAAIFFNGTGLLMWLLSGTMSLSDRWAFVCGLAVAALFVFGGRSLHDGCRSGPIALAIAGCLTPVVAAMSDIKAMFGFPTGLLLEGGLGLAFLAYSVARQIGWGPRPT